MKIIFLMLSSLTFGGCAQLVSFFESNKDFRAEIKGANLTSIDYTDHLASLGSSYLTTEGVSRLVLSSSAQKYLEDVYYRIVRNNELLLDQQISPQITIIKDPSIFFFSLPKGQIFLSFGLIDKYFKSEELLVACLTNEMIKSHRQVYEKKATVPVGFFKIEKMLFLTRVSSEVRSEMNKLSYFAMRRAGYDANAYLNWLQTQNKNTLDFMLQLGEARGISREEFTFKNFLITEKTGFSELSDSDLNSSPGFYTFLNEIKRTRI